MDKKTFLTIELPNALITLVLREDRRYAVTLSRNGHVVCEESYQDITYAIKRACIHVNFLGPFLGELNYKPC